MNLKIQHFVIFITFLGLLSCKEETARLVRMSAEQMVIDSTAGEVDSVKKLLIPYTQRINIVLDSTLAYAPKTFDKANGRYNTDIGNLMADLIVLQAGPIFKSRTGKDLDFALLNYGGIRSQISKGKVSARTAYEVMPFENTIIVVELNGKSVMKMVDYLLEAEQPHPISKEVQIVLKSDGSLHEIRLSGKPLVMDQRYYVATSDYLVNGGDSMLFFKEALGTTNTDYLIRNAMIDYFKKADTLWAVIDNRVYSL
ncbi:hypothetical protein FGM00_09125 [Aggregatimonas sangjinii]|uniref:5'-Nucleotidase C-terminal domain-containing protein n=1 Tax=Aggregatimonas sangjinii TaxID=2583587 RepID=A0A5B7SU65_9FLAO|nr:5'-nucleotidase [Aggregatimonas sangjinii]QCX00264.1 hypothetical protein FGM00_09125 [Aggregatimonas sangjinii]